MDNEIEKLKIQLAYERGRQAAMREAVEYLDQQLERLERLVGIKIRGGDSL